MKLYNSLSKSVEEFAPIKPPSVGLYTCGMTVYDYAHIGHGRKYVGDDMLRRTLTRFGLTVNHIQNVTDVGHLVSDSDEGEDKLEKGAKKQGKTVWEVAEFFTKHFYDTMDQLGNLRPSVICRATEHIPEQIELVRTLIEKGFAYDTPEGVYFDVTKFAPYESLFGRQKLEDKKTAVRASVHVGEHKKHAADFALWFKRVGRFADHQMHWESPWGDGFPGWHIECSAMSMKYLGESFDIHTGGIDHIPVHHPNEIAQSEAATGKQFARFWVHYNFLRVDGKKMSKSLENFYTIEDVVKKGIDPLALRYFYLTSHYRSELNFTWEALGAAASAYKELKSQFANLKIHAPQRNLLNDEKLKKVDALRDKFDEALLGDMNTPKALAVVWETVKAGISSQDKYDLLSDFDEVLGLKLSAVIHSPTVEEIPSDIQAKGMRIDELRADKKYKEADVIRSEIIASGYTAETTPAGTVIKKSS